MTHLDRKHAAGYLFAGAFVGAIVALLCAPQSGKRTIRDIRNKVRDLKDDVFEVVQDGVDHGRKLGADGYEKALQGLDNVKKRVEEGQARLETLVKPS